MLLGDLPDSCLITDYPTETVMSSAPQDRPHYTVEDYRLWKGDWELWNGTAVAMTPSPFGRHSEMLARLAAVLIDAIDTARCDATVLPKLDWIVSPDTVVRPDLSVVCGAAPERHLDSSPALVVEVLSQSTRQRDLDHKRLLYQQQKVGWYLIADPDGRQLTALTLASNGTYTEVNASDFLDLKICDECRLTIDLRRIRR